MHPVKLSRQTETAYFHVLWCTNILKFLKMKVIRKLTHFRREESIGEIFQHLEVISEDKIVLAHNLLKDKNYENEDEIGVDAKREILFNELAKYMKNKDYVGAMGDILPSIRNKIYCWCNLLMKIKSVPYMVKLVKIHALVSMHHSRQFLQTVMFSKVMQITTSHVYF